MKHKSSCNKILKSSELLSIRNSLKSNFSLFGENLLILLINHDSCNQAQAELTRRPQELDSNTQKYWLLSA